MNEASKNWLGGSIIGFLMICIFTAIAMWGCPQYMVYRQGLVGEAKLKRMEQEKKILIETAEAEVEAAKHQAKAMEIVGEAAKKYPEYRNQQFINAFGEALIENENLQIIYVPTEAMIPITEATRLRQEE